MFKIFSAHENKQVTQTKSVFCVHKLCLNVLKSKSKLSKLNQYFYSSFTSDQATEDEFSECKCILIIRIAKARL